MNDERSGPLLPHRPRRVLRYPEYDYATAGGYFVTICTRHRLCCLSTIDGGDVHLTAAGTIVQQVWDRLLERFEMAEDQFIIMPNHVHAVVQIAGGNTRLGEIVRAFKAASTRLIRQSGFDEFAWQLNYHEHIIRNDHEMERIRNCIISNPLVWHDDPENPERVNTGQSSLDGAPWAR